MPAEIPEGDLSRAPTSDPDMSFPDLVEIRLVWGKKTRTWPISANQFFGRKTYGAPMPAEAIIAAIERLRKLGPPE